MSITLKVNGVDNKTSLILHKIHCCKLIRFEKTLKLGAKLVQILKNQIESKFEVSRNFEMNVIVFSNKYVRWL